MISCPSLPCLTGRSHETALIKLIMPAAAETTTSGSEAEAKGSRREAVAAATVADAPEKTTHLRPPWREA